nr:lactosylceramide 1,3-N-acetyl-beta-D-glucosaminyltransferase-like [Dermacentor andersoni]
MESKFNKNVRVSVIKAALMRAMPPEESKIVVRLDIVKNGTTTVVVAILAAAMITSEESAADTICPSTQLNIMIVSTPNEDNAASNVRRTVKGDKPSTKEDSSTNVFTEELVQGNISEWKVKRACRKASLRILYFVHTAPNNTEKRRWLRKTIGDPKIVSVMNSAIVFFVGETSQRAEQDAVLDEAIHEGDVVVLNFTDTYKNLTHKFLLGAKWVSDNCRLDPAVTIVKLDDDVLVNVFALLSYLKSGVMALTGFHCKVVRGAVPFRTQKSKWLVN